MMEQKHTDLIYVLISLITFIGWIWKGSIIGTAFAGPLAGAMLMMTLHDYRDDAYRKAGWLKDGR